MAYWDSKKERIVYFPDQDCEFHSGWIEEDCGCCGGIEWGGESPVECRECNGGGIIYRHKKSGVYAMYPGGPFLGRVEKSKRSPG
jgi:hypothetical protein